MAYYRDLVFRLRSALISDPKRRISILSPGPSFLLHCIPTHSTRSMQILSSTWIPNRYPQSRRSEHIDVYKSEKHGQVEVHDPYEWLEHQSEETERWVNEQEKFTREFLDACGDRKKLEDAIRKSADYPKFSAPSWKNDGRWYWYYNSGLQAQSVIYRSIGSQLSDFSAVQDAGGEVFFDPNLLSSDGTVSLATTSFSKDAKYFAYGLSRSGSDFYTVYVRPSDAPFAEGPKGSPRPSHNDGRLMEEIRFVKFSSISWTHDSKGFFYQRYPARESHGSAEEDKAGTETTEDSDAELYYHRLGTHQSQDILVLKDSEHPDWQWTLAVSEVDGRYLELNISKDTSKKYKLWIADLHKNKIGPNMEWIKVADEFIAKYDVIGNDDTLFYLMTNKDAPKNKIITIDISDPKFEHKELIPEDEDATLEDAYIIGDKHLAILYKKNVKAELYIHSLSDGQRLKRLASDFVGSISVSSRRDKDHLFATLIGFTTPGTVAQYTFDDNVKEEERWQILRKTDVQGLDVDEFHAEQVWYESTDGTKIPMFIVRHRDTPLDGTAPAIQYGYGGFSVSIDPFFSPSNLTFLKKYRGILAVPNIRGGSEFGEAWHGAGALDNKKNCFDDFIAASKYLAKNKYAAAEKITINGGSNGGLLVAACVNRAPAGTFGAAVAEVGVLDLLKYAEFTIGKFSTFCRAWMSDYGNPEDPHDFDFIYPISPIHNVPADRVLPPTILFTADHDDRVVPLHSFKHAATLQYTLPHNPNPLLIRIEKKAGHGAGKSTEQRILSAADKFAFVVRTLGLEWKG